jgi:hypothetical protein
MLVLGYASSTDTKAPSIEVPPFHTGHLGFVPGTPVRISLVAAPDSGRHCEVVVTPFEQEVRHLARVSVSMRDEPGVVGRLVAAVASLGINIEVQESCSINLLDHHSVSLLVDLSAFKMPMHAESVAPGDVPETPTAIRRLYRDYGSIFPIHDLRFVLLFESIMEHCADVIVWKPVSGERLPEIDIEPYADRSLSKSEVRDLVRGDNPLHVKFEMPEAITPRLKQVVGKRSQFEYLLVSDTTTRALHVFFLHPSLAARLFHVGFFHDDVPGALATILALLRDAEFNILTSLVRKQKDGRSVWEAVVEYQGDASVPSSDSRVAHTPVTQRELKWISDQIVAAQARKSKKQVDYDIDIAPPKYPARPTTLKKVRSISLSGKLGSAGKRASITQGDERDKLLAQRRKSLAKLDLEFEVEMKSEQLLKLIENRNADDGRPGVFLSYPSHAHKYGKAVDGLLDDQYRVEKYQEPNGETIVDEVIRLIEGSDYFIGIWHHSGTPPDGERTREVSPWMMFEYGIARAAEKPAIVVHSNMLHPDVWRRIDAGVATPEYTEFDFDPITLETIWAYCERHFR